MKQQDDLEREQEAQYIDRSDWKQAMPAARCRECGVITWKVSLSRGLIRVNATHVAGCSQPPGKFDQENAELLKMQAKHLRSLRRRAMEHGARHKREGQ